MAKQVIENYWCDHCSCVASKHCEIVFETGTTGRVELHFCPECMGKMLFQQVHKLSPEDRAKFISYYRNKGKPAAA